MLGSQQTETNDIFLVPLSSCVYSGFSKCLVSLEKMESKPVHSRCTCEWAAGY